MQFFDNDNRYWWIFVCFLVVTLAATGVRIFMGFTFPIPWPDETDFIAQALAFSRTGSFFVSAMNPDRIVMWMPPGYMLVLAAVFKVFGYSFDLARWVSCILFIAVYALSIFIVRQVVDGWRSVAALALSLCAFLSPYMLATANLARMESLYLLLILCALLFTLRGRFVAGLAVILLTGLVHFNAVYFLPPHAAFLLWSSISRRTFGVEKWEWALALSAALMAGAYAVFVLLNWPGFIEDMRAQFAFKALRPSFGGTWGLVLVAAAYLVPAIQWGAARRFSQSVYLSFYGAGFVILSTYGGQMWYAFGECLGFFLLCLSLLCAQQEVEHRQSAFWRLVLLGVCVGGLLHFSFIRRTMQFEPMWPTWQLASREYVTKDELMKVARFVRNAPPGTTFNFGHGGIEQFFFTELEETGKHWNYGTYSVIQKQPRRGADYRVICDSALLPWYSLLFEGDEFLRKRLDRGCEIIDYPHKIGRAPKDLP